MTRNRIVFGTNSHKIREKVINQGKDSTLDKAVEIARRYELSRAQLKSMEPHSTEAVHSIGDSQPYKLRGFRVHLPRKKHSHVANVEIFMQERLVLLWGKNVVNAERQIILPKCSRRVAKGYMK